MRKNARLDEVNESENTYATKTSSLDNQEDIKKEPWFKRLRGTINDRNNNRGSSNK